jgi:hypothetical protein
LIPITKEKEPEKIFSPSLDASIQNLLQGKHEAESVLDAELLDMLGTPKDSSRDELRLGGKKEEIQQ